MHVCYWISWVGTRPRTSEFEHGGTVYLLTCFLCLCPPRRYHIGRHVGNLQVTNTYEGTFVRKSPLCCPITVLNLATGCPYAHTWQSNNRSSSFHVSMARFAGRFMAEERQGIHYKPSTAQQSI